MGLAIRNACSSLYCHVPFLVQRGDFAGNATDCLPSTNAKPYTLKVGSALHPRGEGSTCLCMSQTMTSTSLNLP